MSELRAPLDPLTLGVVRDAVRGAESAGIRLVLIGALARDIRLAHVHGIETSRATRDVDFVCAVQSWDAYSEVLDALESSGNFLRVTGRVLHRLRAVDGVHHIDILPCGEVETSNHDILWPPDFDIRMNVTGLQEAVASSEPVHIADDVTINVITVPALLVLKLFAWTDRPHPERAGEIHKQADDLQHILATYFSAGNETRLFDVFPERTDAVDFDVETDGARLLGHDIRRTFSEPILDEIRTALDEQLDERGRLELANAMAQARAGRSAPMEAGLSLLRALRDGLQ